jgi:hypothetical protein
MIDLVRRNPATGDAVLQFGVAGSPDTFYTSNDGSYVGQTFSYQLASEYWGANGIILAPTWTTGGASGTFYYSGKIVIHFMATIGGVDYWSIYGVMNTPDIVNVSGTNFGPYQFRYCGHFKAITGFTPVNLLRITNLTAGETFESGTVSVTIE